MERHAELGLDLEIVTKGVPDKRGEGLAAVGEDTIRDSEVSRCGQRRAVRYPGWCWFSSKGYSGSAWRGDLLE